MKSVSGTVSRKTRGSGLAIAHADPFRGARRLYSAVLTGAPELGILTTKVIHEQSRIDRTAD